MQLLFLLLSLLLTLTLSAPQTARRADDLVDSIGTNIHISYNDCCYNVYNTFKKLLVDSGIRHFRDGMLSYDTAVATFNDLGAAGLKGQFIVGPGVNLTLIQKFPAMASKAFLRYEGPNEYDTSGDPNWVKTLQSWSKILWDNHDRNYKLVGPSLTSQQAAEQLGDLSQYLDYGNMHNYKGTFMPETKGWGGMTPYGIYGSTNYSINVTRRVCGSKPIQTSECGWKVMYPPTGPTAHGYLPADVQAKYISRLIFQQFGLGIVATYIYEFCDCGSGDDVLWGLVAASPNSPSTATPRPSYYILKNAISLLSDPTGTSFQPGTLDYELTGDMADVLTVLLQKKSGTFYLVLWIAQNPWDTNAHGTGPADPGAYRVVPPQMVKFTVNVDFKGNEYTFNASTGEMTRTGLNPSDKSVEVKVTDTPMILEINI